MAGGNIDMEVSETETVLDIKTKLIPYTGLDIEQQALICNGRTLKNGDTLEKSKIKDGITMSLVIALRGG